MGFGDFIGRFWRRRDERPEAACDASAEAAQAERQAGETARATRDGASRQQPVDEQAGDSFLGYVD